MSKLKARCTSDRMWPHYRKGVVYDVVVCTEDTLLVPKGSYAIVSTERERLPPLCHSGFRLLLVPNTEPAGLGDAPKGYISEKSQGEQCFSEDGRLCDLHYKTLGCHKVNCSADERLDGIDVIFTSIP